jgi:hypothetical protein
MGHAAGLRALSDLTRRVKPQKARSAGPRDWDLTGAHVLAAPIVPFGTSAETTPKGTAWEH